MTIISISIHQSPSALTTASIIHTIVGPFVAHHTALSMIPHHTISTEPNFVLSSGLNYSFIIASTLAHTFALSVQHLPPTKPSTQNLNISYHSAILQKPQTSQKKHTFPATHTKKTKLFKNIHNSMM